MTTFTKEQLIEWAQKHKKRAEEYLVAVPNDEYGLKDLALAEITLAALTAEPVAEVKPWWPFGVHGGEQRMINTIGNIPTIGTKLYAASPVQLPDGWIRCNERMPEPWETVSIYTPGLIEEDICQGVYNGHWNGDHWCQDAMLTDIGSALLLRKEVVITHWKPLPVAPKK